MAFGWVSRALTISWIGPLAIVAVNLLMLRPQYLHLDQMFCCEKDRGRRNIGSGDQGVNISACKTELS